MCNGQYRKHVMKAQCSFMNDVFSVLACINVNTFLVTIGMSSAMPGASYGVMSYTHKPLTNAQKVGG